MFEIIFLTVMNSAKRNENCRLVEHSGEVESFEQSEKWSF